MFRRVCRFATLPTAFLSTAALASNLIYSEPFDGAVGTQPPGWAAYTEGPALSQLAGNGEYEHLSTGSGTSKSISFYDQVDETVRGAWRDTTVDTVLRYANGGLQNGLLVRASGITDTSSGSFYHVRVNGNTLQLFRTLNNSFSNTASDSAGDPINPVAEKLLRVTTSNIPNAYADHVRIQAVLYDGPTAAAPVLRTIDYTDTSVNALTKPGSVGLRTYMSSAAGDRATFDDLTVVNNSPKLLWYDDYTGSQANRVQTFLGGMALTDTNGKIQFDDIGNGDTSYAVLDHDAETSTAPWKDVEVSTLMRLQTNNDGGQIDSGLVLRETGLAGTSGSGDFYHYRLSRNEGSNSFQAQLYRVINGGFSLVASTALTNGDIPESTDLYLKASVVDEGGGVRILGMASLNADFSGAYGMIDYLDTSASAITGPGSVGYRVRGGTGVTSGVVNFDNFTVTTMIPEPASLMLAGLGSLMLLGLRRRTRR